MAPSASRSASLVPVLPTEPVTPMIFAAERARAARARSRKSVEHVGNDQQRRIGGEAIALVGGHHREGGAGRERRRHEFVAVAVVALDREERLAGGNGAGVDRDAGNGLRQRARAGGAHRLRHRLDASRAADRSCHLPLERGRDRFVVAERQHLFADDLAGFMALAGDQQHVAAAQLRNRALDRRAPVTDLDRARVTRRGSRRGSRRAVRCADCRR